MNIKRFVPYIVGLIYVFISFYLSINFIEAVKQLIYKTDLGWVISTVLVRIFICITFARGFQLTFHFFKPQFNAILLFVIGLLIGFGISFITPIYEFDYGDFKREGNLIEHDILSDITDGAYQIKKKPYIMAFFTPNCPHCKSASSMLGFANSIDNSPEIIALMPGSDIEIDSFLIKNNGLQFEIFKIKDSDFFFKNSGASFPSIFLIDSDGKTIGHWFGEEFNFTALDYIEKFAN